MLARYQEIFQDIQTAIQEGRLIKGERLPSIRQLAKDYSCHKSTIQRALLDLKLQNLIYVKDRSGYFVLGLDQDQVDDSFDISQELPQDKLSPYDDFRKCLNESLTGRETYLFDHSTTKRGLPQLHLSLQKILADSHVYCPINTILVTSGTQQALYILSQMTFPNQGNHILLEQPTYSRMNTLVKQQNLPYQTIARTPSGIDMTKLEEIFKQGKTKFFYTIPRLHNPLGTSLSTQQKIQLLKLAKTYDVYIIEDDYMADFDPSHASPLHYYDQDNRVIYLKSFTTTIFPSLRLAAAVLPSALIEAFIAYKNLMDYDNNLIMQKALSLYLDNGMYAKHKDKLVQGHKEKIQDLIAILDHLGLAQNSSYQDSKAVIASPAEKRDHLSYYFDTDQLLDTTYIETNPRDYIQINLQDRDPEQILQQFKRYLAKNPRSDLSK